MKRAILILLAVSLLAACSMPTTKIYSITIPEEQDAPKANTSNMSLNIAVHSPRYLSQSYIADRVSPYQIDISRYAKWDAPPKELLKEAFKDTLSSACLFKEVRSSSFAPEGFYALEINLKRFEKADDSDSSYGELVFDAVLVSPDGREIYRSTFSRRSRLEEKSFLGLAKALSGAVTEGVNEVKAGVVKAIPSGT